VVLLTAARAACSRNVQPSAAVQVIGCYVDISQEGGFQYLLTNPCYEKNMPFQAPIAHHLDLYAYWEAKRRARSMPARADIDPADILWLLPYLMIIERAADRFRYRLAGTAVAVALGQDPTGKFVGHYLATQENVAEVQAIFERVFTTARPAFATAEFILKSGAKVAMSLLTLPLSDDGTAVNMTVSTLIVRLRTSLKVNHDWLEGLPIRVCCIIEVKSAADLERLCLAWEQQGRLVPQ
jgi:hypothetical protein